MLNVIKHFVGWPILKLKLHFRRHAQQLHNKNIHFPLSKWIWPRLLFIDTFDFCEYPNALFMPFSSTASICCHYLRISTTKRSSTIWYRIHKSMRQKGRRRRCCQHRLIASENCRAMYHLWTIWFIDSIKFA